jgi:hypothetical protein
MGHYPEPNERARMNAFGRMNGHGARVRRTHVLVLVLAVRLLASVLPMPVAASAGADSTALAGLFDAQAICHADGRVDTSPGQAPSKHPAGHAHDCGLCPICHVLAAPALLPVGEAELSPRLTPRVRSRAMPPPSTGPPAILRASTSPRGPPSVSV